MNRRIQRFAQALSDARRTGSRSHAPRLLRRALAAGLGAAIAIAALAGQASAVTRSCAWQLQTTADQVNVAYPDEGAYYWTSVLPISPGGHIEIDGQFPHARYTSITTYDEKTQAIDGLHDTQIHPDPGATNPFLPGADRSTVHRSYTVQIVNQQIPATGRAPNTVYTENADGSKSTKNENMAMFILRIYVPDLGTGIDGGLPLPSVSLVSSSGQRTLVPDCPDVVPDTGLNETIAASGTSTALPISNPPVSAPLVWHKYTNLATALVNIDGDGTPFPDAVTPTTDQAFGSGGFWENLDNNYIYAQMDQTLGQVLVLHAKAPTTPQTMNGEARMGTGQLRYWSMCSEDAYTTQYYGCVFDEEIPLDSDGYYTILISTAAARPANARLSCGVAWLPAGPLTRTLFLMRNMLPSPGFTQAIQNVQVGHEQQDMGAYYPAGRYYSTTAAFEATGCHPSPPSSSPPAARKPARAKTCTANKALILPVRVPKRRQLRSITVYVNGRSVLVRRGKRPDPVIVLTHFVKPGARYRIRVKVLFKTGASEITTRDYYGCAPVRRGTAY